MAFLWTTMYDTLLPAPKVVALLLTVVIHYAFILVIEAFKSCIQKYNIIEHLWIIKKTVVTVACHVNVMQPSQLLLSCIQTSKFLSQVFLHQKTCARKLAQVTRSHCASFLFKKVVICFGKIRSPVDRPISSGVSRQKLAWNRTRNLRQKLASWRCSTVVESWSLTGELSLSCARLLAGRMITLWVRCPR